jgi:hypothetical protein
MDGLKMIIFCVSWYLSIGSNDLYVLLWSRLKLYFLLFDALLRTKQIITMIKKLPWNEQEHKLAVLTYISNKRRIKMWLPNDNGSRTALKSIRETINLNSMLWVRERTIPTERPPLVGEVIANFCGYNVLSGQRDVSLGRISVFLDRSRYFSIK